MEKVSLVLEYRAQGMSFEDCLSITGITRNQFYHKPKGNKQGKPLSKGYQMEKPQHKSNGESP
ncbi:MAG: hypothetical protein IPJ13_11585 [Saprospiraceae bacterium]|nr:hypothetical protein [Saprospiraceae bacterium]